MTTSCKDIPRSFDFEAIDLALDGAPRQYNKVVLVGRYPDVLSAGQGLPEAE